MNPVVGVVIAVSLGLVGRTLLPYLQVLKDNPETQFDRKFLVPAAVSCVVALFTLPIVLTALPQGLLSVTALDVLTLATAFVAGWGVTDIARETQKLIGA